MSYDAAVGLLRQESGKGLDPAVVAKFIELLPSLQAEATRLEVAMRKSQSEVSDQALGQPATGLSPETTKKNVFEDIALAHREIYALYEIAQAMGTSLGVSDTMALIAAKLSNLVPFSCAALFLFDEDSESLRCRFASGIDAEVIQQIAVSNGEGLTGWVARNRRPLVNARPSADLEAAGLTATTTLQSALVCPLLFNDQFIGTLSVYHTEAGFYRDDHRRLLDRVSEQAGAVIKNSMLFEQTQSDSLTDPLTGPPEHALPLHAAHARAGARRTPAVGNLPDGHGPRQLQGDQRQPRPPCRRPRAVRDRARPAHDDPARTTSACATPATSSSSSCRGAAPRRPKQKRNELQRAIDAVFFEARPASACASASASAPRSSRTTATRTRSCSPPPTAACIRTRPIASAARGKKTPGGPRSPPRPPSIATCRARPAESYNHRNARLRLLKCI